MSAEAWGPILDGGLADEAREAVEAIASGLRAWYTSLAREAVQDSSLAGGLAGVAVFFEYLGRASGRVDDVGMAALLLGRAAAGLSAGPRRAGLYEGFTGVIWAVAHTQGSQLNTHTEARLQGVDETLRRHVGRGPWRDDYDLLGGLVGIGVYALERLPRPAAVECLAEVIRRLEETAERRPEGIAWKTAPELLPPFLRERFPDGWYNLGIAHGVPGVVGLLAEACAAGAARESARALLDGAVAWLLARRLPNGADGCFPSCVAEGFEPEPSRLAWCYGDAGIAAALLLAARRVAEPAWEREALGIARRAAERPPERSGVGDAGLCHGAAGLGHVFNRLFRATGEPWLGEAARAWLARALALRRAGQGVGGFLARVEQDDGTSSWAPEPGLLTGAAGVGLALLAATTPVEPGWDRALLVGVPTRRA